MATCVFPPSSATFKGTFQWRANGTFVLLNAHKLPSVFYSKRRGERREQNRCRDARICPIHLCGVLFLNNACWNFKNIKFWLFFVTFPIFFHNLILFLWFVFLGAIIFVGVFVQKSSTSSIPVLKIQMHTSRHLKRPTISSHNFRYNVLCAVVRETADNKKFVP